MKAIFFTMLFMFGIWAAFGSMLPSSDTATERPIAAAAPVPAFEPVAVNETPMGGWQISLRANLIDNSGRATARLLSVNTLPNSIGIRELAKLYVRCSAGLFNVTVTWPAFLGIEDNVEVRYRINSMPVVLATGRGSTSGTGMFAVNPAELVDALRGASELVIEVVPYGRGREEALFQVSGIGNAVAEVVQGCSTAPL